MATEDPHASRAGQVPVVNYLVLDEREPYLRATVCTRCEARYLGSRLVCSRCEGRDFELRRLPPTGRVGSFTIIHRAARGIPTPYVSALVDLDDGTTVKANVVGCMPDPSVIRLGMPVRLTTMPAGTDVDGVEAVAFGFEPDGSTLIGPVGQA
jgi:uncharacterized OB-fold protein